MEYKYRASDKKPTTTTTTTTSSPHATLSYVSEPSLPCASGFSCLLANTFGIPVACDVLLRELEKEQIRREIIAGEIARRRELEAEVRKELALERSLGGIPMQRYLAAPLSFQQPLNPAAVDDIDNIVGVSQPRLQNIESSVEIKPSLQADKDKVIVLAKPKLDNDLHCAKRKAKEEWWCELCQVGANSEAGFNNHLVGKKHKAKEGDGKTQTIGLEAKPNKQSPLPSLILEELNETVVDKGVVESKNVEQLHLVEKSNNIGGLENPSERDTEEAGKTNAPARKKFWCEVCQIHTYSQVVMETHKRGKKHQREMMKLSQN